MIFKKLEILEWIAETEAGATSSIEVNIPIIEKIVVQ